MQACRARALTFSIKFLWRVTYVVGVVSVVGVVYVVGVVAVVGVCNWIVLLSVTRTG